MNSQLDSIRNSRTTLCQATLLRSAASQARSIRTPTAQPDQASTFPAAAESAGGSSLARSMRTRTTSTCARSSATASPHRPRRPSRHQLIAPTQSARSAALRTVSGTRTASSRSFAVVMFFRGWLRPTLRNPNPQWARTSLTASMEADRSTKTPPEATQHQSRSPAKARRNLRFSPVDLAGNKAAAKVQPSELTRRIRTVTSTTKTQLARHCCPQR